MASPASKNFLSTLDVIGLTLPPVDVCLFFIDTLGLTQLLRGNFVCHLLNHRLLVPFVERHTNQVMLVMPLRSYYCFSSFAGVAS